MKPLTAKEVETILMQHGYRLVRAKGSHFAWRNAATGHVVPVPHHGSAKIPQGTLIAIFNACGIEKPVK